MLLLVAHTALLSPADARSKYIARVPNGANVVGVNAIDHVTTTGGARNKFGLAFEAARYQWTPALCALDLDGDDQTNGQELGDPCCEWVQMTNEKVRWQRASRTRATRPSRSTRRSGPASRARRAPTNTTSSTNTTTTANTPTANGTAGQLPSAVGMGITALLFVVTTALAVPK